MKYVIGNWKTNKNFLDVKKWIAVFANHYKPNKNVVYAVAPPFPFVSYLQNKMKDVPNMMVGSQTIATVEEGSYTGEVSAKSLDGLITFAIIGHSERRKHFKETDEDLAKKVAIALKYNITPIYCIRDEKDPIPAGVKFVAYEPVAAIGTGQNEPPEAVVAMKKKMNLPKDCVFIYGGSVNEKNSPSYFATGEIDGFLIGKVSLDPELFLAVGKTAV